jgi:predicted O-methyltransferase YrrM
LEAPLPLLRLDDPRPPDDGRQAEPEPTALGRTLEDELAAVVTEFDCSKTLETGLGRGDSALAIATAHEQRARGEHIAIDADQESDFSLDAVARLRRAGLLHRVQLIPGAAEVALPELLRDGVEIDFALIGGAKRFEDAFVEFLYLDRMLVTGGIMALASPEKRAMVALLEFVAQARAYELRLEPCSGFALLRKLGQQRTQETPFPSGWGRADELNPHGPSLAPENGVVAGGLASMPRAAYADASRLADSSTRELHVARAHAARLEARATELGKRLLDAEQRGAELLRTRARLGEVELQLRQTELGLQHAQAAERWLADLQSSASWRLTAPLRAAKRRARALFGR